MQRPSIFVRKEAKGHGKAQRIEGGEIKGKRVLLVEDLVTTGGSSLSGVAALRDEGAIVDVMLAIVSYGFDEALINFGAADVALKTLTDFETILRIARDMGKFGDGEYQVIRDWFDDPYGWVNRHSQ